MAGLPDFLVLPESGRWSVYWGRYVDLEPGGLDEMTLVDRFWSRKRALHLRDHLELAYHAGRNAAQKEY